MWRIMHPTREQVLIPCEVSRVSPSTDRLPSLFGDLELDGALSFLLHNDCARGDVATVVYIANP